MNLSTYLFGMVFATLLGALFHLWRDGGFWKLILYILLSWVGFLAGHLIARSIGFDLMQVGSLRLAGGALGSLVFLFVGHWFSQVERARV